MSFWSNVTPKELKALIAHYAIVNECATTSADAEYRASRALAERAGFTGQAAHEIAQAAAYGGGILDADACAIVAQGVSRG